MDTFSNLPLVSIAIASYDRPELVRRAVESALAQTYPHTEVVVTDDASNANITEVLGSIPDQRLRLHRQPTNVGCWENWATALRLAKGKYIVLLGEDDHLSENFVACHLDSFSKHPGVDVVFSPMQDNLMDGSPVSQTIPPFLGIEAGPEQIVVEFLKGRRIFCGSAMFVRSFALKVWEEARPEGIVADWGLLLRGCASHGMKATSCEGSRYYKTVHSARLSSRSVEVMTNLAEVCERIAGLAQDHTGNLSAILRQKAAYLRISLGRHHAALGDIDACRRQFRLALSLAPWLPKTWSQLAQGYLWPSRVARTSRMQRAG